MYDQLRLQSTSVSSYDDLGRSVTGVSDLYYVSDAQTTNQAIGYTRCCELWAVEQTSDTLFKVTASGKYLICGDIGKIILNPLAYFESRFLLLKSNHNPGDDLIIKKQTL